MSVTPARYFATATVNTSGGATGGMDRDHSRALDSDGYLALARRACFTPDEYAALQRVVHRAGSALSELLPVERLHVLSLGSRQANRHVHRHLARRLGERMGG
jgi:hypothetical protein